MLRLYRIALLLYPARFRADYQEQMRQTLLDAFRDRSGGVTKFWLETFFDLLRSAAIERILMVQEQILRKPIFFHAVSLGVILTVLGGAASVTMQQLLRRGADQPQAEMAEFYASEIHSGTDPDDIIPPGYVDLERSLEPFVIFYDVNGTPQKSTGYLDQSVPSVPPEVLEYIRSHGSDTVTWQPRPGVRIAAVAKYVSGSHPGYLVAGRSLRLTEEYESLLRRMTFLGWFAIMLLLLLGALLLNRAERVKQAAA
jgi:hypothetical protein